MPNFIAGDCAGHAALAKPRFVLPSRAVLRTLFAAHMLREEVAMAIALDHTIVPAHDKIASARFFARI
jgi:hypothetical protein